MKLNWKGINKISDKGKEIIEDALGQRGEIAIAATFMTPDVAERLVKNNKLSLDWEKIQRNGKPVLHYVFRADLQQRLRDQLAKKQRIGYWFNVALVFILTFTPYFHSKPLGSIIFRKTLIWFLQPKNSPRESSKTIILGSSIKCLHLQTTGEKDHS